MDFEEIDFADIELSEEQKKYIDGFSYDIRYFNSKVITNYVRYSTTFFKLMMKSGIQKIEYDDDYLKIKPYFDLFYDYYRWRGVRFPTIKNAFSAISSLFSYMQDNGFIRYNWVGDYRKRNIKEYKSEERHRQIVSNKELMKILHELGRPKDNRKNGAIDYEKGELLLTVGMFLAKQGVRIGNFCTLNIKNFDLEKGFVRMNKHAKRTNCDLPLDEQMIKQIKKYWALREAKGEILTEESPAFLGPSYRVRIYPEIVRIKVAEAARIVGLHIPDGELHERFTPHCFRHWFTTYLDSRNLKGSYIDELRGDKRNKKSRERYNHISKRLLRKAYLKKMEVFKIKPGKDQTKNKQKKYKKNKQKR